MKHHRWSLHLQRWSSHAAPSCLSPAPWLTEHAQGWGAPQLPQLKDEGGFWSWGQSADWPNTEKYRNRFWTALILWDPLALFLKILFLFLIVCIRVCVGEGVVVQMSTGPGGTKRGCHMPQSWSCTRLWVTQHGHWHSTAHISKAMCRQTKARWGWVTVKTRNPARTIHGQQPQTDENGRKPKWA